MEGGERRARGRGPRQPGRNPERSKQGWGGGNGGGGPSGRRRRRDPNSASENPAAAVRVMPIPKKAAALESLVTAAADAGISAEERCTAAAEVKQLIATPAGRTKMLQNYGEVFPALVRTLLDANSTVSSAACDAIAAPSAAAGPSSSRRPAAAPGLDLSARILDDLLKLASSGESADGVTLNGHQVMAVLRCVTDCVQQQQAAGTGAADRRAVSIVAVVQSILERDSCATETVVPALNVLATALKPPGANKSIAAASLAEVLASWARRSDLPGAARPLLARSMLALAGGGDTGRVAALGEILVEETCQRCEAVIQGNDASATSIVLGLAACAVPIAMRQAAAARGSSSGDGETGVLRLLRAFAAVVQHPSMPPSGAQELCGHANVFVAESLKPPRATIPAREFSTDAGAADAEQKHQVLRRAEPQPVRAAVGLKVLRVEHGFTSALAAMGLPTVEQEERVEISISIESESAEMLPVTAAPAAAEEKKTGINSSDNAALSPPVWPILEAAVRLTRHAMLREDVRSRASAVAALSRDLMGWLAQLPRSAALPVGAQNELAQAGAAFDPLRDSTDQVVVKPLALLYVMLLSRVGPVCDAVLDRLPGTLTPSNAHSLAFDINVLHAAAKEGLPEGRALAVLRSMERLLPALAQHREALAAKGLQLAQMAFEGLKDEEKAEVTPSALRLAVELASQQESKLAAQGLRWAACMLPQAPQGCAEWVRAALNMAVDKITHPEASIRQAALEIAAAVAVSGAHLPLLCSGPDGGIAARLWPVALAAMHDADHAVAQQAQQLAQACALPVALSAIVAQGTAPSTTDAAALDEALRACALQPQRRVFSANQLSQVLDFMTGAAPASVLVGGGGEAKEASPAAASEWLLQLVQGMKELPGEKAAGAAAGEEDAFAGPTFEPPSLTQGADASPATVQANPTLWWYALDGAAKQCVASRLQTHWGSAAQTLATLEAALRKLASPPQRSRPSKGVRLHGICLLHFIYALEQEVLNAVHGSVTRACPSQSAALYWFGNVRVWQEWLTRVRPIAVEAALKVNQPQLAYYHSINSLAAAARKAAEGASLKAEAGVKAAPTALSELKSERQGMLLLRRAVEVEGPSPAAVLLADSGAVTAQELPPKTASLREAAEEAVAAAVPTLCALQDGESILGLQALCTRAFPAPSGGGAPGGKAWGWLEAAALHAVGRHEDALHTLQRQHEAAGLEVGSAAEKTLATLQADLYASVSDWDGLQAWLESCPQGILTQPAASEFAALAAWGRGGSSIAAELSSASPSSSLTANAVRALAGGLHSVDPRGLLFTAARDTARDLSTMFSFGPTNAPASAVQAAEGLGVLAALQMAAQPSAAAVAVHSTLLPALGAVSCGAAIYSFSAWAASPDYAENSRPAADAVAQRLMLAAPSSVSAPEVLGSIKLAVAAAARDSNNLACAGRLLKGVGFDESCVDQVAGQRLQELLLSTSESAVNRAPAVQVLERLVSAAKGGENAAVSSSQVFLRVGLTAALHTPSEFAALAADYAPDAELWWQYAQSLNAAVPADIGGSASEEDLGKAAAALHACSKALALCAEGALARGDALPITALLLRLMVSCGEAVERLHPGSATEALIAVPAAAWLPLLPLLVSHLATSNSNWMQRSMYNTLKATAAACPAALFPLLSELRAAGAPAALQLEQECRALAPDHAQQMEGFMEAVTKLALLEDERWTSLLQEAAATLTKRLAAAYSHLKALRGDLAAASAADKGCSPEFLASAAAEELEWAVFPVLCALRSHVAAAEGAPPATPHEESFRRRANLLPRLRWMLDQLGAPLALTPATAATAGALETALQRPLQCVKKVAAEIGKGLTPTSAALEDVCPGLSALSGTYIPVPGAGEGVTIASVAPAVTVLHTKTRPKKIEVVGSDGRRYCFLVKGREDLRVDANVARFLHAATAALRASRRREGDSGGVGAGALPLVVVPVAARAGLVGWVDDAVPLYEMCAAHEDHRRQRAIWLAASRPVPPPTQPSGPPMTKTQKKKLKKAGKERKQEVAVAEAAPVRPVDQFRTKLQAAGVNLASSRSSWPAEVLRSVYLELAAAAPSRMIAVELVVGAAGAHDWWLRQRSFSRSTAVMSMLGYFLGLGDRHLDNILWRSASADVVHVDFGVLFDRGAQLAAPEIVPFRLTQSIATGLGPAGADGAFRGWAEITVAAVRANAASLSSLLCAAVGNSLVAWAPEGAIREARTAVERCASLAHFLGSSKTEGGTESQDAAAAAESSAAVLRQFESILRPFQCLFANAAAGAVGVAAHCALVDRCTAAIEAAASGEAELVERVAASERDARQLSMELVVAVSDAAALEADCRAWQDRHLAVIDSAVNGPARSALAEAVARWDPQAAEMPLGMVQPYGPRGSTLVGVALGVRPATAPLSPSVLLKAATVDDAGAAAMYTRAEAMRAALQALERYSTAVAILGGAEYVQMSRHAGWLPALAAAAASCPGDCPLPNAPDSEREASHAVVAWRVLRAQSSCSAALLQSMRSTQSSLRLERIDVALMAGEAKERAIAAVATCKPAHLARSLSQLCSSTAATAAALSSSPAGSAVLDGMQQLVLGLATTTITARDAVPGEAAAAWLSGPVVWLSAAVRAADAVGSLAAELQLLAPSCAALLESTPDADALESEFAKLRGLIDAACGDEDDEADYEESGAELSLPPEKSSAEGVDSLAGQVMSTLLQIGGRWQTVGTLLQCLNAVLSSAGSFGSGATAACAGGPSTARLVASLSCGPAGGWRVAQHSQEALLLGAAAVDLWSALSAAWKGGKGDANGQWHGVSHALASSVSWEVQRLLLPALEAELSATAIALAGVAEEQAKQHAAEKQGNLGHQELEPFDGGGEGAPPMLLPAFLEFGGGEGDDDLFGALEEEIGGEEAGWMGAEPHRPAFSTETLEENEEEGAETVNSEISAYAEAAGALAAIDAVLHVAELSAVQAAQQAQHAATQLAAHQWRHEPALASGLQEAESGALFADSEQAQASAEASSATALAFPRHDVVSAMRTAIAALDAAAAEVGSWRQLASHTQHEVASDLAAAAPYVSANVRACLEAAQEWDITAERHARNLGGTLRAVLDFEASREFTAVGGSRHDGAPEWLWPRYSDAVQRVHVTRAALLASQGEAAAATGALEGLRRTRDEAAAAMRGAEKAGVQSTADLGRHALPLVKATKKLPSGLHELHSAVETAAAGVEALVQVQRRAARLQLAGAAEGTVAAKAAASATATLGVALPALRGLPAALSKLQRGVQTVRRDLQQGGRGEAAAREQAGGVVTALQPAMDRLTALLDVAEEAAVQLEQLPQCLDGLRAACEAELKRLCSEHCFNPQGFATAPSSASPKQLAVPISDPSPHLYPPPTSPLQPSSSCIARQEAFAREVMLRFERKVSGTDAGPGAKGGAAGAALDVKQQVEWLVRGASSVDNLSRMFEGWMPWV